MDRLFEIIDQESGAQGTKYQVLLNFGICRRELGGEVKVTSFRAFVRSFCFVELRDDIITECFYNTSTRFVAAKEKRTSSLA